VFQYVSIKIGSARETCRRRHGDTQERGDTAGDSVLSGQDGLLLFFTLLLPEGWVASYAFSVDFYMWTWFVVDSVGSG
jgi:hypothetical protein